ncbi:hypothetical protein C0J52_19762 [Blattella germanica]|nr:hypothetical protein C0J52_19762 [Blattella germanica]
MHACIFAIIYRPILFYIVVNLVVLKIRSWDLPLSVEAVYTVHACDSLSMSH